jgi:hypothetical protein
VLKNSGVFFRRKPAYLLTSYIPVKGVNDVNNRQIGVTIVGSKV